MSRICTSLKSSNPLAAAEGRIHFESLHCINSGLRFEMKISYGV
jgi:hypothetical protein